jgi:hypothetical protein
VDLDVGGIERRADINDLALLLALGKQDIEGLGEIPEAVLL